MFLEVSLSLFLLTVAFILAMLGLEAVPLVREAVQLSIAKKAFLNTTVPILTQALVKHLTPPDPADKVNDYVPDELDEDQIERDNLKEMYGAGVIPQYMYDKRIKELDEQVTAGKLLTD